MKQIKYHYHVLMTRDLFEMMEFICLLVLIKTLKKQFLTNKKSEKIQKIFNKKKRFLWIKRIQKSHHEKERIQGFKKDFHKKILTDNHKTKINA